MSDIHPQRLYLIQVSASEVLLPNGQTLPMVCVCYLVQMNDGRNILIDTGMPKGSANGEDVIGQLAEIDVQPSDVNVLICTHFDVDHAGNHAAFADAEFVVQRAHYEHARGDNPRFATVREQWDRPGVRWRIVDGDTVLLPGLELIETSGHTLGHQSVLVRLPETGTVLLAIDAVILASRLNPDVQPTPNDEDGEALRASTRKLIELAERERAVLVVFGHDGTQWRGLRKLPEFYG